MHARTDHLNNRYNEQTAILAKRLKESKEFDETLRVRERAIKEAEGARVYAEQDRDQLLDVIDMRDAEIAELQKQLVMNEGFVGGLREGIVSMGSIQ